MKNVLDVVDLTLEELNDLISTASDIIDNPEKYSEKCKGKKLATLFYEPSTRTRLSFTAAMMELGGNVLGFSEASSSSAMKGESVADTAKIVSCYADIIAMRSPIEGAPLVAALNASIPVINAGDGGHCHPTQTLGDLLTIHRELGRMNEYVIGFCGDLKYGRTVHSFINAISKYKNIKIYLISPEELKIPNYVKHEVLNKNNIEYIETTNLDEAIPNLDVLYMTRIQQERFSDIDEYNRLKNSYILTIDKLTNAKNDLVIMHPLPRVNEISVKVDDDPRACYFKQALYGKYMRMALILKLLDETKNNPKKESRIDYSNVKINEYKCTNPKCISQVEQELDHIFKCVDEKNKIYRCIYCEKKA
ncbi:MAG: aspartate carbamoyltransferase [Clostridia bacterium]|nr:aspartate carbamoyltransferase [Clostridia bacterium]